MASKGGNYRSAKTGQYVNSRQGQANPRTTVREAPGKSGLTGGSYRSAISGQFVTTKHGKASPHTTIREK